MEKLLKRLLLLSLVIALIIISSSFVCAETTTQSGTCGENVTWELDSKGVLTISGNGEMGAFSNNYSVYNVKEVVIKTGVTSISSEAFDGGGLYYI